MNYEIIMTLLNNCFLLGVGYFGLKRELIKKTDEIKDFNDNCIKRTASGTVVQLVEGLDRPIYVKQLFQDSGQIFFKMLELNSMYSGLFGIKRKDWINKPDLEAGVPKEIADLMYQKNIQVWSTRKPEVFIQPLPDGNQRMFREMPYANDSGQIVGVMGYEISRVCEKNEHGTNSQ